MKNKNVVDQLNLLVTRFGDSQNNTPFPLKYFWLYLTCEGSSVRASVDEGGLRQRVSAAGAGTKVTLASGKNVGKDLLCPLLCDLFILSDFVNPKKRSFLYNVNDWKSESRLTCLDNYIFAITYEETKILDCKIFYIFFITCKGSSVVRQRRHDSW